MSTGSTIAVVAVVAGGGIAAFLYFRSQTAQTQAQAAAAAAASGIPASGGGISGTASRLFSQWKSDPLGIQNTKAIISGIAGVGSTAVNQLKGLVGGIF